VSEGGRELTDLPHFPLLVQQSYLNSLLATVSPLTISYKNPQFQSGSEDIPQPSSPPTQAPSQQR